MSKHPKSSRDEVWVHRVLWTIVNWIWIREVRREQQKRNLSGSGSVREPLSSELIDQVADKNFESGIALQEELDDIKPLLSPRQEQIVLMRLESQHLSEISSGLNVCKSTIDKDIATIKKVLGPSLNNEQRTTSC